MKNIYLFLAACIFINFQALAQGSFSLSSPANGAYASATPYFSWATSSNASSYQLYLDGKLKKDNISTNYYQITSGEEIAQGMHTWYVVAVGSGTTQSNETWSVKIDATPPSAFNLLSPADNSWTANLQPTLKWNASLDANSGLAKYQLWIDGVLETDKIKPDETSITPALPLSNGSHTWQIKAVDNVGNMTGSSQTWTVKVDNIPPGLSDNCLFFDGVNDYAVTTSEVNTGNVLTMEAWIKPFGKSALQGIIETWGNYLTLEANNKISFHYYLGSSNWNTRYSNKILDNNTWYYISITHNNNTGKVNIYINGKLDASYTNCFGEPIQSNVLYVGKGNMNSGQHYFYGNIDEVKLWGYERTQTEIQNSMNKVVEPTCSNGLIGYWRFNDKIGTTLLKDEANGSYNLTLLNGASITKSTNSDNWLGGLSYLKQPVCSQYLKTTTPAFSWDTAPDAGVGFQKFQLWIDGALNTDNLTDSSFTIKTPLTYGKHTWFVKGFDKLGNNQSSYVRAFYVDNAPPDTFNLLLPKDSGIVNLPTPNFSWQATKDSTGGSGMSKYQLWINGVINRDSIPATQTTVAPSKALPQGAYTWFVKAYDNVGNVRQSTQKRVFYVDWEPPTAFSLISPADSQTVATNRPVFTWHSSSDIGSGLSKYELNISGTKPVVVSPSDTSLLIPFDLPNGTYTWFVKAFDLANSSTSSATEILFVKASLPAKPEKPAGITSFCKNPPNTSYTIHKANYATSYLWSLSPAGAGAITGTDTLATVNWNDTFSGTADISVKGRNLQGYGLASDSLAVIIHSDYHRTDTIDICEGESYKGHNVSGVYTDSLQRTTGCDSIVITDLTVNPVYQRTDTIDICQGESYKGHSVSGIYTDSLQRTTGCDSIVITDLTVNPVYQRTDTIDICEGESYKGHNVSGVYTDSLQRTTGCDSIVITDLTVNPTYNRTDNISICQGKNYKGHTVSGIYTDSLQRTTGCDSIVLTKLTVNPFPGAAGIITGDTCAYKNTSNIDYSISSITDATSYIWSLPKGASGKSTTNSISVSYGNNPQSGRIIVKGHNGCGNGYESSLKIEICTSTGVSLISSADGIKVYPNLVKDKIHIAISTPFTDNYKIVIYNNFGALVQTISKNKSDVDYNINLSTYPSGFYIVKIGDNKRVYVAKVFKK